MVVYAIFACMFLRPGVQRCAVVNPNETYRSLAACRQEASVVYGGRPGQFVCHGESVQQALRICRRYPSLKCPPPGSAVPADKRLSPHE